MAGPASDRSSESERLAAVDRTRTMVSTCEISLFSRASVAALAMSIRVAAASFAARWKLQDWMAIRAAPDMETKARTAAVIDVLKLTNSLRLKRAIQLAGFMRITSSP